MLSSSCIVFLLNVISKLCLFVFLAMQSLRLGRELRCVLTMYCAKTMPNITENVKWCEATSPYHYLKSKRKKKD